MATVIASFSMSVDGFIADPHDEVGPLFDWYNSGDVETRWPGMGGDMVSHTTAPSARYLAEAIESAGAIVAGRRLFDYTKGWGGNHPLDVPVFVVTHGNIPDKWLAEHPEAPFEFVTEGVEAAVERASGIARDKFVCLAGANVAQQALNAGLVDVVHVDLVPVLLGKGIRFFDHLDRAPVMLENPNIIPGDRVTHMSFRVRRR